MPGLGDRGAAGGEQHRDIVTGRIHDAVDGVTGTDGDMDHHGGRLALCKMPAKVDDQQAIGDSEQRMHHMLDPYDRHALFLHAADFIDEFVCLLLGQAARDFIKQQQFRPGRERASEFETLAVQQRQRAGQLVRAPLETGALKYINA